jgi:acetate kinase
MSEEAQRYPLPHTFWDLGVRRYGFHGLSCEYVMSVLGEHAPSRIIIAHLGNGASLSAVRDGRCIDTTMGMTPAGGIMMGTRPGDLDPGVLLHLLSIDGAKSDSLNQTINHESGLLGVSGVSPDMKTLLEARSSNPNADLAIRMFCRRARKEIGAFTALLEGLDLLVFTGGIGERAAEVRAEICNGLACLGITIDAAENARHADVINETSGAITVRVIPTNEDLVIARHALHFC